MADMKCTHALTSVCKSGIDVQSRRCKQRVTEPHSKFHERQEFITLRYTVSFVRIWSASKMTFIVSSGALNSTHSLTSEFEVEMLEEASCSRTHCCKLCVAPNSRTKTDTLFPSIRCGLHIFHRGVCV